ncbi:RING-type domain-containing protein [Caenorhabditis elegans]|uniref:RING-type domain-containing protein n=1 Tax=Caenorhabditis elegans TaxID=6239 RepID=Q95XN5_CAEEL|nr:RING-type domain-containing protein [Caenorhabditis elegans]CCD67970.1 RING-type domain-containing protein [Caenorhabditis elegans]|eukprot:NP_490884.2 Uncharacterized protein CELE_Y71G12B.13 [Caenorhabditis elegans]
MPPGPLPALMKSEWLKCPRCKTKQLKPELISTEPNGSDNIWWICEAVQKCQFPMDMPPHVYHVVQTAFQKRQKCIPLPRIEKLPEKYQYLYPLTFANSRPVSRCSSVAGNSENSENRAARNSLDGTTTTTTTISEKSSGQNRLKAESLHSETVNNTNTPSTSCSAEAELENQSIDDVEIEEEEAVRPCRTIKRRLNDSGKSWASLIEKVAADSKASNTIINMEESELFRRMQEFFDAHYFQRTPMTYKRSRAALRLPYRIEDIENCLQSITREDWKTARRRMINFTVEEKMVARSGNADELLKSVGIDLQQIKKAVGEKVGNVMRNFSLASLAKRRKIEEDRKISEKLKAETRKQTIHQSVSARILNKKLRRDEETARSLTSTPSPAPAPASQFQQEPEPVQFHVGNYDEEPEYQEHQEPDAHWGFEFDDLYERIDAQNHQAAPLDPADPLEAMLLGLEEAPIMEQHLDFEPQEHSGDEAEPENDDDDVFTGFNVQENSEFVNDNFDF